jgi:S-layer homology domain
MSKIIWKSGLLMVATAIAPALVPSLANANEEPTSAQIVWQSVKESASSDENNTPSVNLNRAVPDSHETGEDVQAQVTSVDQFRDVTGREWAYEALKNLVEGYGCIVGYPDGTYRGDRALSRYEFAAGMNACLESLERRLGTTTTETTSATDSSESLTDAFGRAFNENSGTFYESTGLLGQLNTILGIVSFTVPAAFPENQIVRDAELISIMYKDAIEQQSSLPRLRTRDLPNPYETSVLESPDYVRFIPNGREVIIDREP